MDDVDFRLQVIDRLGRIETGVSQLQTQRGEDDRKLEGFEGRLRSAESAIAVHAAKIKMQAGTIAFVTSVIVEMARQAWQYATGR